MYLFNSKTSIFYHLGLHRSDTSSTPCINIPGADKRLFLYKHGQSIIDQASINNRRSWQNGRFYGDTAQNPKDIKEYIAKRNIAIYYSLWHDSGTWPKPGFQISESKHKKLVYQSSKFELSILCNPSFIMFPCNIKLRRSMNNIKNSCILFK